MRLDRNRPDFCLGHCVLRSKFTRTMKDFGLLSSLHFHADRFVAQFTLTDARPISEPWSGHATLPYDTTALGLAQVGTNLGLDVVVLCFPIPVISRLHMPTQRKVAVGMIFWLGILSVVACLVDNPLNADGLQLLCCLHCPARSAGRVSCYHRLRPGREHL